MIEIKLTPEQAVWLKNEALETIYNYLPGDLVDELDKMDEDVLSASILRNKVKEEMDEEDDDYGVALQWIDIYEKLDEQV